MPAQLPRPRRGSLVIAISAIVSGLALGASQPREPAAEKPAQQRASASASVSKAKISEPIGEAEPVSIAQLPNEDVELQARWQGFAKGCAYLAPKGDFVAADGSVDVVFHFHAGMMAEREMRESGLSAVFVSCGWGTGSGVYADEFADAHRFDWLMHTMLKKIGEQTDRDDVHVRHLTLASWSAGFASISRILAQPRWYDATEAVVLLDGLHAKYDTRDPKKPAQGKEHVELRMLSSFVRFARDAAAGKKTMVVTHSSIVPPDYASAAESTAAMLDAIGVPQTATEEHTPNAMTLTSRADSGGLHVRGYRGAGPRDHFAQLHLFGEVLRSWVVPVYTHTRER